MRKDKIALRPPNLAAKALRGGLFRHRKVKNGKNYCRKIKFKKGERDGYSAPSFLWLLADI